MIFRLRRGRRADAVEADQFETTGEVLAEIDRLSRANRTHRDLEAERRILRLRHWAGARLVYRPPADPELARPSSDALPERSDSGLPEFGPDEVTPALLRAAILRDGCLLVRGLINVDDAAGLAQEVERAFVERAARAPNESDGGTSYYDEFEPDWPFPPLAERPWIEEGGGVLAIDSPKVMFDVLDLLERAGLSDLVGGYLGERPALSAQKSTLRKAEPEIPGAWHQDGAFLGNVRALNLWVALSHCGDEAPGLDIVPRRLDHLVQAGTEETFLDCQVSQAMAEDAAGEVGIHRPIFEPGDALLFDDLFLHQTGSDPTMPKPRYALEAWFFSPSAFPKDYAPIAF